MSQVKKLLTFGGTFSVALGIGFVMQNGDAMASRFSSDTPEVVTIVPEPSIDQIEISAAEAGFVSAPVLVVEQTTFAESETASLPDVDNGTALSQPIQLASADADSFLPEFDAPTLDQAIEAPNCDIEMAANVMPAAMVELSLTAPCHPDARFTMHHQGMMFTHMTDASGTSVLEVPALAVASVFIAAFADGEGAVTMVDVPDLPGFDRVVLQWDGDAGMQLHAREFGAQYGDAGHIWSEASGMAGQTNQGFLVSLGTDNVLNALHAEVYTFPRDLASQSGEIVLSAEIEITDANCGQDISAQSLQVAPGDVTDATDLTLAMPTCESKGDFLVLQNMFEDLTLAAR